MLVKEIESYGTYNKGKPSGKIVIDDCGMLSETKKDDESLTNYGKSEIRRNQFNNRFLERTYFKLH